MILIENYRKSDECFASEITSIVRHTDFVATLNLSSGEKVLQLNNYLPRNTDFVVSGYWIVNTENPAYSWVANFDTQAAEESGLMYALAKRIRNYAYVRDYGSRMSLFAYTLPQINIESPTPQELLAYYEGLVGKKHEHSLIASATLGELVGAVNQNQYSPIPIEFTWNRFTINAAQYLLARESALQNYCLEEAELLATQNTWSCRTLGKLGYAVTSVRNNFSQDYLGRISGACDVTMRHFAS